MFHFKKGTRANNLDGAMHADMQKEEMGDSKKKRKRNNGGLEEKYLQEHLRVWICLIRKVP